MHTILSAFFCLPLLVSTAQAQELKTAAQDSPPKFIRQEGAPASGISVEVMQAISRIDPTLSFVGGDRFMPLRRIEHQLEDGELDVFFGFARNKRRLDTYHFIEPPLYRVANVLAVRRQDPIDIRRLEEIKALGEDGIVMVVAGHLQVEQLKTIGIEVDDRGTSLGQNVQKLVKGRGRFVFQSESSVRAAIRLSPPDIRENVRILPTKFNVSGRHIAFSKNVAPETVAKVERALEELHASGELQRIANKHIR